MSALTSGKRNVFMGHLMTIAGALGYLLPFDLFGIDIKNTSFSIMIWSAIFVGGYTITTNYGSPDVRSCWAAKSIQPLAPWLMKVSVSPDFQMLFFSLIWISVGASGGLASLVVCLILGRRAVWSVAAVATVALPENAIWLRLKPHWESIKANQDNILQYMTFLEIGLGFLLIVKLFFPSRLLLSTFLQWQFLKMRYMTEMQAKGGKGRHITTWGLVDTRTRPYLDKVPMVAPVINYAKKWFTAAQ